jgi:dTMP kinase
MCDRFYDSTTAYQGYGRQLALNVVKAIVDFAVGDTRPDLTLLLVVPYEVSESRRVARQPTLPLHLQRDRMEEADRDFFQRVAKGYQTIAASEPNRVRLIPADGTVAEIQAAIWKLVKSALDSAGRRSQ